MKRQQQTQYGSFFSVPTAYERTEESLRHAIKFEFRTVFSEDSKNPLSLEDVFSTDKFLVDLGAVAPEAIDPSKIAKDCDFVKNIVLNHPKQLQEIIQALQQGDIEKGLKITEEIGFTEDASVKAGGGAIGLIIVVLAVVALGGCAHCPRKPAKPAPRPAQ